MTSRERVTAVLNFKKPDRLPVIEWAPYWDQTVERWRREGLPAGLETAAEIRDYFELDRLADIWIRPRGAECPQPAYHGGPIVSSETDYDDMRHCLYPNPAMDPRELEQIAMIQENGAAVWCWFESAFWHPRKLFGIESHLYAFYDQPQLMRRMNEDLLEYLTRTVEQVCEYVTPQYITLAEDMSYNHGPMISKDLFDEHLAWFYIKATELMKSKRIKVFVDSDGLVDDPVDWYTGVGCQGFLPLEKQAGVDILNYRQKHPNLLLIGAFDKMCMHKGEEAIRLEFERLLPVMRQGGYIPGVDHQTPPEVSLDDYKLYLKLLREYAERAAQ